MHELRRRDPGSDLATEPARPMKSRSLKLYDMVRVKHGPLAGLMGFIHGVNDDGTFVVLLEDKNKQLLPPLPFRRDQLATRIEPLLFAMRLMIYAITLPALAYWLFTQSLLAQCIFYILLFAVWLFARVLSRLLSRLGRKLKTCPKCEDSLDSDSAYSWCPHCGWIRPMPSLGRQHLQEFEAANR
jgi:hypothetical protein